MPDLILLDFVLPDMKGDEVCRQLVADPATAKIPVVYVSGFGSDLQPDRSEIPNVIGSISKPFTSETLVNAVRTYLGDEGSPPREIKPALTENSRPRAITEAGTQPARSSHIEPKRRAIAAIPAIPPKPNLSSSRLRRERSVDGTRGRACRR